MQRKSTPEPKLSHVARFVRHVGIVGGISQTELADRIGTVSKATVSRWLSDKLTPSESDLGDLARAVQIPVETFRALRVLDALGPQAPMFATSGAFYHLASGRASTVFLAGLTMLAGTYFFRQLPLQDRTLLVSTVDPESEELQQFEERNIGRRSGSMILAWLTSLSVLATAHEKSRDAGRIRFWIRPSLHLDGSHGPVEIAGNNWVALETDQLPGPHSRYRVHFYGDESWGKRIAPLLKRLERGERGSHSESLLWDSAWLANDHRYLALKRKLKDVQNIIDLTELIEITNSR